MSVYVDKARNAFGRMVMSHMIADTLPELHDMAARIGLKLKWFQATASWPHYDVSQTKRAEAVRLGAIELDRRELVRVIRRLRAKRASLRALVREAMP